MEILTGLLPFFGAMAGIIFVGVVVAESTRVDEYLAHLGNRYTSFGRIHISRRRRKALAALVPAAIAAVEYKQLRSLDEKRIREFGMALDALTGRLAKEPDVVQALAALKKEHERRAAISSRTQWVTSTIEKRAKAIDGSIRDLEQRNEARIEAGLVRIDDELLWKAPLLGTLGDWSAATFATDRLQIAAVFQMEELLHTVAETSDQLVNVPTETLTPGTFWAVGTALELFANTLPKAVDSPADQALSDRIRGSYAHWCREARKHGPAPIGESLLSRDIIVNAAKHELDNLQLGDDPAGAQNATNTGPQTIDLPPPWSPRMGTPAPLVDADGNIIATAAHGYKEEVASE